MRNENTPSEMQTIIPRCQMMAGGTAPITTTTPCWWTENNPAVCPDALSQTHTALHVERGGNDPAANTHVIARCVAKL